jgi:ERCC4-related helicase
MTARDDEPEHGDATARAGERVLRPLTDRLDETAEDDVAYQSAETDALTAARRMSAPLTAAEKELLHALRDHARKVRDRPDAKFAAFLTWLDKVVREADERVIIFTEYRDTQRWLLDRLIGARFAPEQIKLLYGGQYREEREQVKNVFQESKDLDPVRILLATDAGYLITEGMVALFWR